METSIISFNPKTVGFSALNQKSPLIPKQLHCPNPKCSYFHHLPTHKEWFKPHGSYFTKAFGEVPRALCLCCGKTFSTQTFSIDYYVKKPVDYMKLIRFLVTSSGQRNIWRFENLRVDLTQNRYERIARMFLALQAELNQELPADKEFVLDGFESFSRSQNYPNNINILVGRSSEYIYGMGLSVLRRKGRMTAKQKRDRTELEKKGRADPKATRKSVTSLLEYICELQKEKGLLEITLNSDQHKDYERVVKQLSEQWNIKHVQTSSKDFRGINSRLFPVNYADRQFRKDLANHVRETIQFSRCPSAMMVRMTVYQGYHNLFIPRRVKQAELGNMETRCEFLGMSRMNEWAYVIQYLGRRPFFQKAVGMGEQEQKTWKMEWRNPGVPMNRYVPKYIFS